MTFPTFAYSITSAIRESPALFLYNKKRFGIKIAQDDAYDTMMNDFSGSDVQLKSGIRCLDRSVHDPRPQCPVGWAWA